MIDIAVVVPAPPGAARHRAQLAWVHASVARRLAVTGGAAVQLALAAWLATSTATPRPACIGLALLAPFLATAALVDVHEQKIPNRVVAPGAAVVAIGLVAGGSATVGTGVVSALLAAAPLSVVVLTRGLGLGDVKLAALLGLAGGPVHFGIGLATVFAGALTSGVYGIVGRRTRLALAPWLWAGFLAAVATTLVTGRT